MSLVVVGSVAYDGVETPHGKVDRMLGGAATYISLASSYFTKTRLVGIVGDDFAEEDTELLASRDIDLEGLERAPGKTFFWAGKYSDDMNDRTTLTTDLNVFADFDPKIPPSYRHEPYLLLGNIQPGLQRSVLNPAAAKRSPNATSNGALQFPPAPCVSTRKPLPVVSARCRNPCTGASPASRLTNDSAEFATMPTEQKLCTRARK